MRIVERIWPSGRREKIEVEDSLAEVVKELERHHLLEQAQGIKHGIDCSCMDKMIRRVHNYVSIDAPGDYRARLMYIIREVSRMVY
jgi:hypothetical protein